MARDDVELVRRVYARWAVGDFSSAEAFHPDVEFDMRDWPGGTRVQGLEAMRRAWRGSLRAWDDFRAAPSEFIDTGRHVVVLNHITARGKGSGAHVSADTATVWTVQERKVVRLALYWDVEDALAAAAPAAGS
jgi:ketosteroid isomerase-like protein